MSKQLQDKAGNEAVIMISVMVQYVDYTGNMSDSFHSRIKLAGMQLSDWLFSSSGRMAYAE